jgi:flagellar biosynthetic protein FlhB
VTYLVIKQSWQELMALGGTGPSEISAVLRTVLIRLGLFTGIAFLSIAVVDYLFQRSRFEKSMRMTRQEVVYEHRETDGDPIVKSRVRALMMAQARRRMMQQVPKADVVVVNPTAIAVALKYDMEVAPAPVIVAMGQRKFAQRIRDLARKADVPIVENRATARALLATGKVGKPIPPALYAAVAEILAFVYRQRAKLYGLGSTLLPGRAS